MASCVLVSGLGLLLMAFVACGVAFFAPFWLQSLTDDHTEGLWGYCPHNRDCTWFHEDDFALEKTRADWFKASQALYSFGFVMQIAVILIAVLHVCCLCCKESFSMARVIGGVLICSSVLLFVAIAVFGGMAYKDENFKASIHSITYKFDWAFYVAVGGGILNTITGLMFFIEGFRGASQHEGYHEGKVI